MLTIVLELKQTGIFDLKVLMLGWELPPFNSGGLGVACYELCRALAEQGTDIDFVLPYETSQSEPFMKIISATTRTIEEYLAAGQAYDSKQFVKKVVSESQPDLFTLQEEYEHAIHQVVEPAKFDVIHAHDWLTFRAALRAKQLSGKPLILHVHATEFDRSGGGRGNPLVHEIEELGLLMADKVIAVSQLTKNSIVANYNIPPEKVDVVHNSIRVESNEVPSTDNLYAYIALMKSLGYGVVSNVGRLTLQKGLVQLLQAAALVIEKRPKTIFLLVGSGEQRNELISLSASLGISRNVVFAGFQRGQAWRDAFTIADLFVMPSISEPFGLSALEASGFGVPILISKQSGVTEVVRSALKVDFWDTRAMADQIVGALDSPALRTVMSRAATKEISRMSWKRSAREVSRIYGLRSERARV